MYDRNFKSERILTKLRVLDYEYICDRMPNFVRKDYLLHELLIFKYWRQNISVSNSAAYCSQALRRPAHRTRETVHLLAHETPDFITSALWPANSPDLNPVDYQIWGSCGSVCIAARSWRRPAEVARAWSKSGNISTRWSWMI